MIVCAVADLISANIVFMPKNYKFYATYVLVIGLCIGTLSSRPAGVFKTSVW